jgi:hypothetical protein
VCTAAITDVTHYHFGILNGFLESAAGRELLGLPNKVEKLDEVFWFG